MPEAPASPAGSEVPAASERARLARVALGAAIVTPGVAGPNEGENGRFSSADPAGRLGGVVAVAEPGGRYTVDLYLTAELVPLHALAERVRQSVQAATQGAGMAAQLGAVSVHFLDLVPGGRRI